jgi:hypothetical protein
MSTSVLRMVWQTIQPCRLFSPPPNPPGFFLL